MATIYYSHADYHNPELSVGTYIKSGVSKSEAKEFVKSHNKNLTDEEKENCVEYDYLNKDYTEEEFYNLDY